MGSFALLLILAQGAAVPADSGEAHLRNVRQLTFGGQNAEAYYSASGRLLIFQRQGPDEQCDQMYVMTADGGALHRVSSGRGRTTCGYFYDRDRRIFYSSTEHGGPTCPPRPDYSPGYDAEGTLSPDGQTIVFTSLREGDLDIYTMGVDGSHLKRLTTTLGYDGGPFFSHDGRHIVYRAYHPATAADSAEYKSLLARRLVRPTRMDIWVMNADGSDQRQVTHVEGASFAPYFHPDDRRIIFASNYRNPASRDFDLYLVNVDGSGLERVTTSPEFDAFPMFSPDGKQLVWASNRRGTQPHETNIFVADWVERP